MSSITTKFTLYFEGESVAPYVINGFKLHSELETAPSIKYYKPKSPAMADFIKNTIFTFTYFSLEEGNIILGEIDASTSFSPEIFLDVMVSMGCSYILLDTFNDQVGETNSLGVLKGKIVKATTVLNKFKELSPTLAFKAALHSNKSKQACEFIKSGINPDIIIDGKPAIVYATGNNMPNVVRVLLESGANPNAQNIKKPDNNSGLVVDHSGNTALHLSVFEDMLSTTQLLLKYKADPNIQNEEKETPLSYSFDSGYKYTDELLKFNCDLNLKNKKGMTPLLVALYSGDIKLKTLKLLINNGASAKAKCKYDGNALWYVCEQGNIKARNKMIVYLKEKGLTKLSPPSNIYTENLFNNLKLAIEHSDKDFLNNENFKKITNPAELAELLGEAIFSKNLEVVMQLINNGANPSFNISTNESVKFSPLMYAKEYDKDIYKYLKGV